jgi:uncharacterized protein YutE (UPF0331/DUF86 family)
MVDREIFLRRLEALRGYLGKLEPFKNLTLDEFVAQPAIHDLAERYLHLMMECVLDLGNHYLADQELGIAETNRDIFLLLQQAGELDKDMAEKLMRWAGFRNILAHEYLAFNHAISWKAIQSDLPVVVRFFDWAASKI